MTILNILYVIAGVLLLFGAAIFFHELGHFWVARKLGMKVEEFAIGMGPIAYKRTHNGIVYSIRWIPAGGFVKLPQMITSEALEGKNETPVPAAPPFHKILVALAGPAMNVIFAFVVATIIYFVGLPVSVNPPIIGHVDPASAEAKAGIKEGDRIVSVSGEPIKSWEDVTLATVTARTNVLEVVTERDSIRATNLLTATANPVIGLKLLNLDPRDHPEVINTQSGSAAEAAGLKPGDKVIAFAGVPIASREQLIDLIKSRGGQATEIRVQRGGENVSLTVTPKEDPAEKVGRIGAVLGSSASQTFVVQRPGPTPWAQVKDVWNKTIRTFGALLHSKQTGVGAKDLSGPVGILTMLAINVNTDYRLALSFLVLLNINLAVLNLLPVPVLDGGHIMMSILEKIRRRPLSQRFVEYVTTAFAIALIGFMLYVSFFDLKRFSLFKSMFRRDTQIEQKEIPPNTPLAPVPAK
jgi:regulator of sigma E protease